MKRGRRKGYVSDWDYDKMRRTTDYLLKSLNKPRFSMELCGGASSFYTARLMGADICRTTFTGKSSPWADTPRRGMRVTVYYKSEDREKAFQKVQRKFDHEGCVMSFGSRRLLRRRPSVF